MCKTAVNEFWKAEIEHTRYSFAQHWLVEESQQCLLSENKIAIESNFSVSSLERSQL